MLAVTQNVKLDVALRVILKSGDVLHVQVFLSGEHDNLCLLEVVVYGMNHEIRFIP